MLLVCTRERRTLVSGHLDLIIELKSVKNMAGSYLKGGLIAISLFSF